MSWLAFAETAPAEMSGMAWLVFAVVGGFVWGGFLLLLLRAARREGDKS